MPVLFQYGKWSIPSVRLWQRSGAIHPELVFKLHLFQHSISKWFPLRRKWHSIRRMGLLRKSKLCPSMFWIPSHPILACRRIIPPNSLRNRKGGQLASFFLQLRRVSSFDSLVMEIGCTFPAEWAPGFRAIKTYLTFTPWNTWILFRCFMAWK